MKINMWATVTEVSGNTIKVKFDNGDTTEKKYRYPKSGYTPVVGDRAYFLDGLCIGIY